MSMPDGGLQLNAIALDQAATTSSNLRYLRRAYVSPENLRKNKLVAGEWAKISNGSHAIILQLWPRVGTADSGELDMTAMSYLLTQRTDVLLAAEILETLAVRHVVIRRWDAQKHSSGILRSVTVEEDKNDALKLPEEDGDLARENDWIKAVLKENLGVYSF
jgi:hypothetical protein